MNLPTPMLFMMEAALNQVLRQDDDVDQRLAKLQGKRVRIHVEGLGLVFDLSFSLDGVSLLQQDDTAVDATISGPPFSLLHQAINPKDRSRVLDGDIRISGDMELGQKVQMLFAKLEIDVEAMLASLTGDVAAHQLGELARGALSWLSDAAGHFASDSADYASYERRDLVAPAEMKEFVQAVDVLREDCDRLSKRIEQLERVDESRES